MSMEMVSSVGRVATVVLERGATPAEVGGGQRIESTASVSNRPAGRSFVGAIDIRNPHDRPFANP